MIKLFRKVRQNLLTENKFSKYLLYAIGEIVLVVIGILIALTINNSNQNRINKEKEQTYLHGLFNEFQTSKKKLEELILVNKNNYNGAKKIIDYCSDNNNSCTENEFSELLFNTFSFDVSFNPNNSLLTEMINSGSLKDISNNQLRIYLTNWIATLEDIAKQEYELGIQREKVIDTFRKNNYSIRTIFDQAGVSENFSLSETTRTISNLELLNSLEFENNVLIFILTCYATETSHYLPLMEDINTILSLIENELKK